MPAANCSVDKSHTLSDSHAFPAYAHPATGPVFGGSTDVLINSRPSSAHRRTTIKKSIAFAGIYGAAMLALVSCAPPVSEQKSELDRELRQTLDDYSPTGSYTGFRLPDSNDYAAIPNQDPKNPVTAAKVELGKMLFFETGLALEPFDPEFKGTFSCGTCHIPSRGFTAGRFQGVGDGALGFGESGEGRHKNPFYGVENLDVQGARPLPVINTAYVTNALWAGAFGSFGVNAGTESAWHRDPLTEINFKGLMGLEANNERALIVHRLLIDKEVTDSLGYTSMFDKAFPELPESERYTRTTGSFAISAYFRTILTNEAPFQKWLRDDSAAMTEQQKRGALLFFGKAECAKCHNSPSLNTLPHQFYALGVKDLYQTGYEVFGTSNRDNRTLGRGGFTGRAEDIYKFKVPQLYNLKDMGFYFHGASQTTLRQVVEYFNDGIPENPRIPASQITTLFHPLNMTSDEIDDLVEFLENGLYDPNLARYMPTSVKSGSCFPNNDKESRIDMGCL